MPNINYNFNVSVESGPSDTFSNKLWTEAYDKVHVTIATGDTSKVSLQPMASNKVKFICIKSDQHSQDDSKKLTYKADDLPGTPPTPAKEIDLDHDQVLIGSSLIGLLGDVKILTFTNKCDKDAHVEILVARGILPS